MNEEMKRLIMIENYQNPKNRGLVDNKDYCMINTNSKSCIDQIDLQVKFNNGVIEDIRFDGEACAICTSTTSIMIGLLIGKTKEEALNIIENYKNMIDEKEYNFDILKEAIVYSDISKEPNRKNCALLTWNGMEELIKR